PRLRAGAVRPDTVGSRAGPREPPSEVRHGDMALRIGATLPAERQGGISRHERLVVRERGVLDVELPDRGVDLRARGADDALRHFHPDLWRPGGDARVYSDRRETRERHGSV